MNRPDLAPLMLFLVKEFGGNWAISGSVALHMHAVRQNAVNEMTRAPADVDIVMRDQDVDMLQEKLRKNNHDHRIHRPPFSRNPSTFHFGDGLKVDVLRAGGGVYGNLSSSVRIGGLPVLSLDQLVASKQAALDVAREEKMEVATQYEADLRVLEILQQKEREGREASSSTAAGGAVTRSGAPFESRGQTHACAWPRRQPRSATGTASDAIERTARPASRPVAAGRPGSDLLLQRYKH